MNSRLFTIGSKTSKSNIPGSLTTGWLERPAQLSTVNVERGDVGFPADDPYHEQAVLQDERPVQLTLGNRLGPFRREGAEEEGTHGSRLGGDEKMGGIQRRPAGDGAVERHLVEDGAVGDGDRCQPAAQIPEVGDPVGGYGPGPDPFPAGRGPALFACGRIEGDQRLAEGADEK